MGFFYLPFVVVVLSLSLVIFLLLFFWTRVIRYLLYNIYSLVHENWVHAAYALNIFRHI